MKKYLVILTLVLGLAFVSRIMTGSAYANGDKVRGDKAKGPANQLGECPFGPMEPQGPKN